MRTSPLAAKFEAALQHHRLNGVPKHIVSEAKAAHKQLDAIKAIAEKHIDGPTQTSDEDKPTTEDKTIVPNAQECHKALTVFWTPWTSTRKGEPPRRSKGRIVAGCSDHNFEYARCND